HIIFDSLTIDASGAGATYGFGVHLINNADSNVIRNCNILINTTSTSTNYAGIVISNSETSATTSGATRCDGNLVDNNTITGGYYGITLTGNTAEPVTGNQFINNRIRDFYNYGIYLNIVGPTLVEKNDISRPTRTVLTTFYGVYGTGTSNGVQVSKNKIHNPFDGDVSSTSDFFGVYFTGFDANAGTENIVSNNLIYDINGEGDQTGLYNSSADYALYYHNTVVLEDATSVSTLTTRSFYQTLTATGIKVRNNIFTIKRGGSGTQHALYFNTATSQIESDRNVLFLHAGTNHFVGRVNATDYATLAQWRAASAQDAGSESIDPEYANVLMDDYTPTLGAIDNLGLPVGITTDIVDAVRSTTTPDAGATEFAVPPCQNPPTPGTTVVAPNSGFCIGTTVILSLSGNSVGGGQTYQWQSAPTAAGPWTNISPVLNSPAFQWAVGTETFFQAVITCSGTSVTSSVESVTLNPYLLAGVYTIDPSSPPSATNYQSFQAAVSALDCGIGGDVFFDAVPGTYTEQIRIRPVGNANINNRVTFRSQNGDRT
ncbi:MAG: right-handed parallel beta-helix repeat-containing protein, partial [Sphingobacteriales bacterium]